MVVAESRKNVTKRYGNEAALRHARFAAERGEVLALLGP